MFKEKYITEKLPPVTSIELISVSLAITTLGIHFIFLSPEYFQRSGALLVCIAIWFGLIDLGKHIDCSILSALKKMVDEERGCSASWFLKDLIANIENPILHLREEQGHDDYIYNHYYRKIRKRIILIEACIAMVGTIVWAYGDLIS